MYYFAVLFALLTIAAALGVVLSRSPMHSALYLVLTFILIAVHYTILQAHFVAALQVMVYAGAIMVLVVFVIMLMGVSPSSLSIKSRLNDKFLSLSATVFSGLMFAAIYEGLLDSHSLDLRFSSVVQPNFGTTAQIGKVLFTRYVYPFELISLLLLAAIIGSVVLAREPKRKLPEGRGLKAMQELEQRKGK